MKPEVKVVQPLPAPHPVWSFFVVFVTESENATISTVMVCLCFNHFLIFGPDVTLESQLESVLCISGQILDRNN